MVRVKAFCILGLIAVGLVGCSPLNKTSLDPPDVMAQLSNADLSAHGPAYAPARGDQRDGLQAMPVAEKYPGDDRVAAPRKKIENVGQTGSGYEINFNGAELSELAKVILKDTLGIPYVFDPRVQGRVTVSTGGPVSRTELLAILESVLAMNHGSLIVDGKLYRIVPEDQGRLEAASTFDYVKESKEIGTGYGVSVYALKYVSTDTMMRMLESLSAKQEGLRASVNNNLLFLRGTSRERESVAEFISMFDVDWMKGQSAGIYTLKNSAPDDIIKELQEVVQSDSQGKGLVRFQSLPRLNAILVLTQKSHMLNVIEQWVMRLDRPSSEGENYYVYRVENGRAKDLAQLLMQAFSGGGGVSRGPETNEVAPTLAASRTTSIAAGPASMSAAASAAAEGAASPGGSKETPPAASTSDASFAPPPSGQAEPGQSEVRITPDERNNKLLIKASARDYRKILDLLRRIDQPPLQVLINATLAEVTLNDNLAYGVQFFLQKHNGAQGVLGFTNGQSIEIAPNTPGLNFIVGNIATTPRIILDALSKETTVRVVSSPSVVVLHNQAATLQVGDDVPIITRQAQGVVQPDSPVVNEIEFRNTGVILKVTPRINSNGLVTMEIDQEISAVVNNTTGGDTLTPTISQRRISSTIAVQSGQMVVLGGLISEQLDREKNSIPVINKIPYLGDILGAKSGSTRARTELVVFLQPSVIRDPEDASRVAEAVRAGMQSLAPRPTAWDVDVKETASRQVK